MRVKEWNGDVVFLYEVVKGNADRSYGVHVAKLAGLPKPVIKRASEVLALLETDKNHQKLNQLSGDLPLFTAQPPAQKSKVDNILESINADSLSPRDALDLIYQLKEIADGK